MLYDENFVKPEIRDGWPVSEMIKKSWWIQLDLLQVFDRVCKKHNLRGYRHAKAFCPRCAQRIFG